MDEIKEQPSNQVVTIEKGGTNKKSIFSNKWLNQIFVSLSKPLASPLSFITRHLKAFIIIIWILVISIQVIFTIPTVVQQGKTLGLDDSWFLGLPAELQNNDWSGRDFYFTYGPLWQLIALLGSNFTQSGSTIDGHPTIILAGFLLEIGLIGLSVALIKQLNARNSFILLVVITILNFQGFMLIFRPMATIVCILLVQRCLAAPNPRRQIIWAAITGVAFMLAQMISADLGVYSIGGAIVVLLLFTILGRFRNRLNRADLLTPGTYLALLGVMIGVYLATNLLLSLFFTLTSPNYRSFFDYQFYNFEILRGYSYTMGGLTWQLSTTSTISLFATVIFVICLIGFNFSKISIADSYMLICLAACSVFQLKGATIRSDLGHIILGALPLFFLFLVIGIVGGVAGWYRNIFFRVMWVILAFFLLASWPYASLKPFTQIAALLDGSASFAGQMENLTTGHLAPSDILPTGLTQATDPTKELLSFPQDNFIPIAMNKKFVAPIHQAYSAFTTALQKKYTADLQRLKNTFEVVYGLDALSATMLENVQQVTRVPIIFEYLYRNYTLKTPKVFDDKYVLLTPRTTPTDFISTDLAFTTPRKWDGQLLTLKLSKAAACSMLRVTPKINYPVFSLVGRPSQLNVKIWSTGKIFQESSLVAIEPGKPFSTYISLMDPNKFYTIFSPSQSVQTKELDSIQIMPLATAFLSFSPSSVDISKIECITFK